VSDITRSETKKSQHIIGALLCVSMTVDCLQASFVGKSWHLVRLAHINSNLDDQGVICLLDGRLFCQKTVAIYPILPMLFLSTIAQKL